MGAVKSDAEELNLCIINELKKVREPLAYLSLVEAIGDPAALFFGADADKNNTLDFILET